MAAEVSGMASLREFEEKPGPARAGDGRGQPPVRQRHVEGRQHEAPQPGVRIVRLEAVALAEGVEEIGQGDEGRNRLHPAGQYGDRVVDAGEHDHEVHRGPRRGLGPRAEEEHQAAHEETDHERGEEAAEEEQRERPRSAPDEVEAEGPGSNARHEEEDHDPARHPDQPRAEGKMADPDGREELVLHGLRPYIEKHGIGDVELADLYGGERHRAHEDEGGHARVQMEEAREKAMGQHGHPRPEGELEHEEHVAPRHDDVAVGEGPRAHELGRPGLSRQGLARQRASSTKTSSSSGSCTWQSRTSTPCSWSQRRSSGSRFSDESTEHSTWSPRTWTWSTPGWSASAAGTAGSRRRTTTSPIRIWRFSSSGVPSARICPLLMKAMRSQSSSASRM